jgi:hypothetical protein
MPFDQDTPLQANFLIVSRETTRLLQHMPNELHKQGEKPFSLQYYQLIVHAN